MQYFPHLCILHKKFIKFNYKIKSKKNMKKFKFGVLAMVLVSMLGFTSCLDSGDPGPFCAYSNVDIFTDFSCGIHLRYASRG